jgi:hypothetical protein
MSFRDNWNVDHSAADIAAALEITCKIEDKLARKNVTDFMVGIFSRVWFFRAALFREEVERRALAYHGEKAKRRRLVSPSEMVVVVGESMKLAPNRSYRMGQEDDGYPD